VSNTVRLVRHLFGIAVLIALLAPAGASAATFNFFSTTGLGPSGGAGTFGPATSFPSSIEVAGLQGPLTKVTATMIGFGSGSPDDVDMLLVGPEGEQVMLMSDACGEAQFFTNNTWTFDGDAPSSLHLPAVRRNALGIRRDRSERPLGPLRPRRQRRGRRLQYLRLGADPHGSRSATREPPADGNAVHQRDAAAGRRAERPSGSDDDAAEEDRQARRRAEAVQAEEDEGEAGEVPREGAEAAGLTTGRRFSPEPD
jgi:hypothetical protein